MARFKIETIELDSLSAVIEKKAYILALDAYLRCFDHIGAVTQFEKEHRIERVRTMVCFHSAVYGHVACRVSMDTLETRRYGWQFADLIPLHTGHSMSLWSDQMRQRKLRYVTYERRMDGSWYESLRGKA